MPKVVDATQIHKAALEVISERGYEAATTKEIARRAGVNEVTLYRRFGTKAALIEAPLWAADFLRGHGALAPAAARPAHR